MKTENDFPFEYALAKGPDELSRVLDHFLERSQIDPHFAKKEHYILYELGNQKSLIKTDMSEKPFQFWYYDLLGRPATNAVKETVAKFLWEQGGESKHFDEPTGKP